MATRVTLTPTSPDPDAPVHVAKVELTNDRGDRQAEAAWLRLAARPGIVPILDPPDAGPAERHSSRGQADTTTATERSFTITTEHVGSTTLRTALLRPEAACAAFVELAELLVELHRDGFVHGKLTVDHVIVGADRLWLCSPDGNATDPSTDLVGLARCMHDVQRQWTEAGHRPGFQAEWSALADRLADEDNISRSASRTLIALRRLSTSPPPAAEGQRSAPSRFVFGSRGGFVAVGIAAIIAIGGLTVLGGDPVPTPDGTLIEVDGSTYSVGGAGDDVVALDRPCDPTLPVLVLDPATDTVWGFSSVGDGETARPIAVVPGATDLRAEWVDGASTCTIAVARGPAGVSVISTEMIESGADTVVAE